MADSLSVEISDIDIVYCRQLKLQLFALPCGRHINSLAVPHHAVKTGVAHLIDLQRLRQQLPSGVVIARVCPQHLAVGIHATLFLACGHEPVVQLCKIFCLMLSRRELVVHDLVDHGLETRHLAESLAAHPRLYVCASPAGHDKSDGHPTTCRQRLSEEIACGREALDRFGRTFLPCVLLLWQIGGWQLAHGVVDMHETHVGG